MTTSCITRSMLHSIASTLPVGQLCARASSRTPRASNPKRSAMFADLENMGGAKFIEKWFPLDAKVAAKREVRALLERTGAYSAAKQALWKIRERVR